MPDLMMRVRMPACRMMLLASAVVLQADHVAAEELTLDGLSATRLRPLFSTTRRPLPPPPPPEERSAQAVAAPPPPPPDVVLSAVVIGPDMRVAFLKRGKDAKALRITADSKVDGWAVTAIEARQVVLQDQTQTLTLELAKRPGAAVPTATGSVKPAAAPVR